MHDATLSQPWVIHRGKNRMQLPTSWKAVEKGELLREGCRQKFRAKIRMATKGIAIVCSKEDTAALLAKARRRSVIEKGLGCW